YFLFYVMVEYGLSKLLEVQFPRPRLERLAQPVGELSPMGLVWLFMGESPAYRALAGIAQISGGVLLLSGRTCAIGALVLVFVMSNVLAINLCFDVPVKLFSAHLLIMALVVLLLDHRLQRILFSPKKSRSISDPSRGRVSARG